MSFNFSIRIKESESQISSRILKQLKPQVNSYFKNAFNNIKQNLVNIVIESITQSPEYQSLLSGDLKYEFGLPDSDQRLNNILTFWEKIDVEYKPVTITKNQLIGKFSLGMIQSDYSDVLGSSASILVTEKGQSLNWLEWLLLFGNQTIIRDYIVEFGPNPNSRTGRAVMRGVTSGKWSVPSEFSGVANDNWITRSIESAENEINTLINNSLKS